MRDNLYISAWIVSFCFCYLCYQCSVMWQIATKTILSWPRRPDPTSQVNVARKYTSLVLFHTWRLFNSMLGLLCQVIVLRWLRIPLHINPNKPHTLDSLIKLEIATSVHTWYVHMHNGHEPYFNSWLFEIFVAKGKLKIYGTQKF